MADGTIHAGTIVQVKPDSLFIGTYEPREIQIKDIDSVVSSLTTEEFKQAKHYG